MKGIPILHVEGDCIARAWELSLIELHKRGCDLKTEYDKPEDPPSKDATMFITITDPLAEPMIHKDFPGGPAELQEYVMEVCDGIKDHLVRNAEDPKDTRWEYTYHQRLFQYQVPTLKPFDQIELLCQKLAKTPHTRRAQAITWKVWEDNDCYDPACMQSIWCRLLEQAGERVLSMNVRFRSNDAYKAAFMNIFALVQLQQRIAARIAELSGKPVVVGRYCHMVDSYHIYGSYFKEFEGRFLGMLQKRSFEQRTLRYEDVREMMEEARPGILEKVKTIGPSVKPWLAATMWRFCALALLWEASALAADQAALSKLERSYWLHASLASSPLRGYWGMDFPAADKPSEAEIRNAVRLLTGDYSANRLYLIYHRELPLDAAEALFTSWRRFCSHKVEVVPTLVLRAYDKQKSEVFPAADLTRLATFFKRAINPARIAFYDVEGKRDQGPGLAMLAREFPGGLVRVGIQPDEAVGPQFVSVVQDTWSGFCHGKSNHDWQQPGFGAETLWRWVEQRNGQTPVAWDLVTVAWDYSATERGAYPGYDDARKNMPLPAGRNELAVRGILSRARSQVLAGFSSDLFILHANSRSPNHDGAGGAFYETLKRGAVYRGYYATPFGEVTGLFQALKKGRLPKSPDPSDSRH